MIKKLSYNDILLRLKKAGINKNRQLESCQILSADEQLMPLDKRVEKIIEIFKKAVMVPAHQTLGFIMYDIEDNKIRRHIAKYLEKLGYMRIQKSIFFGNISRKIHQDVYDALKEINEMYDNSDSIVFLPVSSDDISRLKLVGRNIEFNVMLETKNVLFF
ncbi:CRISPR-associated endonuclease Cas2 [Parafilimonas sp.]|uniref:CRISPR-associated endonuclease Cas2 n=1 Tax=Parafilimonas sp. TaxID=1969739 RepID=UPI0039E29AC5